jgi:hypothetical protein
MLPNHSPLVIAEQFGALDALSAGCAPASGRDSPAPKLRDGVDVFAKAKCGTHREVFVFLPPGYATAKARRYPVVYALHGYSIGAEQWTKEIHVPQTVEGSFAQGESRRWWLSCRSGILLHNWGESYRRRRNECVTAACQ